MSFLPRLTASLANRYRLERQLGAGGMATVYLAHDLKHDRPVAIKVLRPELAALIGAERFLAEIRTTANLQHPNILSLFDSGDVDGLLFYVMPYVGGETLRTRLDRESPLPLTAALHLVEQIADALEYAHKRGIVHRDIKPENILLHEGRPLVADFGIAHAAAGAKGTRLTQVGMTVGTPGYMSPEQAAGEPEIDGRSDQYSLACVLSEMLAGGSKSAGSTAATALTHTDSTSGSVAATRADLPAHIESAIRQATSRQPQARFATISAFVTALLGSDNATEATHDKSIAVLPFQNMSADPENDYFADGMAEEILNALTQLPDLRVAARTSAFSFKGKADDLRSIGEKLRVRHVLEGSVRKAGTRLRITVQLVSVADGYQLWSERYDRQLDDVFAIQDEIASTIAAKLQITLGVGLSGSLIKPATENLQAYDEYLKGMAQMRRRGAGIVAAIESFRRAVALDPEYAPALAGLAHAMVLAGFWGIASPADLGFAAIDVAARALASNPLLVEAHIAAALVAFHVEFDQEKATNAWARVLELGPADPEARTMHAVFCLGYLCGRFDLAAQAIRVTLDSDPLNPTRRAHLAVVSGFGGEHLQSVVEAKRAIELDPDALYGRWALVLSQLLAGSHDDAIATGIETMRTFGRHAWIMMAMVGAYTKLGRIDEATSLLDELQARSRTEYVQPVVLAVMASYLGRRDESVQLWLKAAADRDTLLPALALYSPFTTSLRAQPEHVALLRQLGWKVHPAAT
ncbi:MAG: protein kinase [Acidobacteriota bacterium]